MAFRFIHGTSRFLVSILSGSAALLLLASPIGSKAAGPESWPSQVNALYRVTFNGFDVGSFEFNSTVKARSYVLSGNAQLSALLGLFQWQGLTRSAGDVVGAIPKPAAYTFDYRSPSQSGSIKVSFKADKVARVSAVPPMPVAGTVPLEPRHLKDVLDPLSAVMALTKAKGNDPCAHRLALFDGKQRFDLQFSYVGQTRLNLAGSAQPGVGYVCNVKYLPIAGYRPGAAIQRLAASNGIKIVLRPIAAARLLVPHQIIIPTGAGDAVLTSQRVSITTKNNDRIGLVN